jgi:putative addiction module component (TIGR02574 family)
MATASNKLLGEAMKLPSADRVRLAEKLLESVEAEGAEDEDESDAARHAAWADEIKKRSQELREGSVQGLSVDEARRIVASDPTDDR